VTVREETGFRSWGKESKKGRDISDVAGKRSVGSRRLESESTLKSGRTWTEVRKHQVRGNEN